MFIQNKYTKLYLTIVYQAKLKVNNRSKNNGYFEKHHIIPKCLGGLNGENIVILTAREHFICHRLLVKMTSGEARSKMACAMFRTISRSKCHKESHRLTSKTYEKIKLDFSQAMSKLRSGKIPYVMTDFTRERMSASAKKKIPRIQTVEEKRNRSINQMGRKFSFESRAKMSDAHHKIYICPYCNKSGGRILKRWHFDNCKNKSP